MGVKVFRIVSAVSLILLVLFSQLAIFQFIPKLKASVSSSWYYSDFQYRVEHNITGSSTGDQTNYQIKIVVRNATGGGSGDTYNTTNIAQSDFDDVRFTWYNSSSGEEQPCDYWRETYVTGEYAIFWVEVPTIPSSGDTTIYIYYGKSDATTTSNGTNTFIFFDDFTGDLSAWTQRKGTWAIDSSDDTLYCSSDYGSAPGNIITCSYSGTDYAIESKVKLSSSGNNLDGNLVLRYDSSGYFYRGRTQAKSGYEKITIDKWTGSYTTLTSQSTTYTAGQIIRYSFMIYGNSIKFVDWTNDYTLTATDTSITSGNPGCHEAVGFTVSAKWYWFAVRKYVEPEPTHGSWGTEEEQAPTPKVTLITVGHNATLAGTPCKFYAKWSSTLSNLSHWIFGTNNTGTWINETYAFPEGVTEAWSNITKTLTSQVGVTIAYQFWANNTAGNWTTTGKKTFTTTSKYQAYIDDMMFLLDTAKQRQVNSTFPYSYHYDEFTDANSDIALPDLLAGAIFYNFFANETWLEYTYEIVKWLNESQDYKRIFYQYNTTSNSWVISSGIQSDGYWVGWLVELNVMALLEYAKFNTTWKPFVQEVVNVYISHWINQTSKLRYSRVEYNGTIANSNCFCSRQSFAIALLAYAGHILQNETLKQLALDMALAFPLSGRNLPYREVTQTKSVVNNDIKEDDDAGQFLAGLCITYYYTGESNETLKQRIKDVANAVSTYFWHSTNERFVYMVDTDTGSQVDTGSVHGFGVLDEALIQAYLVWGNSTWLERARSDFDDLVVEGNILINDLICHYVGSDNVIDYDDATLYWNIYAFRTSMILYSLNVSGIYQNSTYLDSFYKLYNATSDHHRYDKGWVMGVDATDLTISTRYKCYKYTAPLLGYASKAFSARQYDIEAINTLGDLFNQFGVAFISVANLIEEDTEAPTYSNLGTNTTIAGQPCLFYCKWSDNVGLSGFILEHNNTGTLINETWTSFDSLGTGNTWSNITLTLNSTVGVVIQWRIYANDTNNNWNVTDIQYLTTTFYAEITIETTSHSWSVLPGQSNVLINEGNITITVTANANFTIQVKGSGNLTCGSHSIPLSNVKVHKDTLASAISLSTSWQDVPGLVNVASGTDITLTFKLWLTVPDGTPAGEYTYTLYIQVVQYNG